MDISTHTPTPTAVTKVGAVVLRVQGGVPKALFVQPHPKPNTPEDVPPLGLPRGTRMYRDPATGAFIDADHDGSTQPPEGVQFEPVYATFLRELEEETGIHPVLLDTAKVTDMGGHMFASRTKEPYVVHWFSVMLKEATVQHVPLEGMQDSLHARWLSMAELEALVAENKASPGYIDVMAKAIQGVALPQSRLCADPSREGWSR